MSDDELPRLFNIQTACTCVAALDAIESLVAADAALDKELAEPRTRARKRVAQIAARWCKESATPALETWKGIYQVPEASISHADLKESHEVPLLKDSASDVESLPWGPLGSMYRIVPGFRGLFADVDVKERYENDLFREIAYRLVALQDQNGQWSAAGNRTHPTATESLTIALTARDSHRRLINGELKNFPDPIPYQRLSDTGWGAGDGANDEALFPTVASLVFLVEGIDEPVSLDGIEILPETATEPDPSGKPDPKRTPVGAAKSVARPNVMRTDLFDSLIGAKRGAKPAATPASGSAPAEKTAKKPAAAAGGDDKKKAKDEEEEEYKGLDKLDSLLEPAEEKE